VTTRSSADCRARVASRFSARSPERSAASRGGDPLGRFLPGPAAPCPAGPMQKDRDLLPHKLHWFCADIRGGSALFLAGPAHSG